MAKTGKRSNRGWWWDHFVEHPGYATKDASSTTSGKAKVIWAFNNEEAADEITSAAETLQSSSNRFIRIAISDLLDYSRAEEWLGSFYQTAIRGLDAELELYKLLDLDAEGIDDSECPRADDVLDE